MKTLITHIKDTLHQATTTPSQGFIFATISLQTDCEALLGMADAWRVAVNPRSRQDIWQNGSQEEVNGLLALDEKIDVAYTANADFLEVFGQTAIPADTIKGLLAELVSALASSPLSLPRAEKAEVKRNEVPCDIPCRHIIPGNRILSEQVDQMIGFLTENQDLLTFPKVAQKCASLDRASGSQETAKALVALAVEVHLACTTSGIPFTCVL